MSILIQKAVNSKEAIIIGVLYLVLKCSADAYFYKASLVILS